MAQQAVHRRLSAILAADVVDYSRLMEADEAGTLAALNGCRHDLIEPAAAQHQGRIFKTMGDGFLIEFGSVVEAVQCAVDLQAGTEGTGDSVGARKIRLRIGVNLGDILVEQDDLYGDGINIAARLQSMAEPGAILLSGTVYDHLKSKIAVGFAFVGERRLKNISEPVRVYRVLRDGKDAACRSAPRGARLSPGVGGPLPQGCWGRSQRESPPWWRCRTLRSSRVWRSPTSRRLPCCPS
ncbi:MAG: adenylate/guanylate cyclase domain-containing protein [Rhodospirillaceae bacterium]|nr:adenylate/guanylate cyclase domain-containing protein [Rhodospirillaceae bacterium]